jgi:hypothetical protein
VGAVENISLNDVLANPNSAAGLPVAKLAALLTAANAVVGTLATELLNAKPDAPEAGEPPIGPDEAVKELHLPNRRALYRLKNLPFDRSRNQKDRLYDPVGLRKWRDRKRWSA